MTDRTRARFEVIACTARIVGTLIRCVVCPPQLTATVAGHPPKRVKTGRLFWCGVALDGLRDTVLPAARAAWEA